LFYCDLAMTLIHGFKPSFQAIEKEVLPFFDDSIKSLFAMTDDERRKWVESNSQEKNIQLIFASLYSRLDFRGWGMNPQDNVRELADRYQMNYDLIAAEALVGLAPDDDYRKKAQEYF